MSLNAFYTGLARLVADPELVRAVRADGAGALGDAGALSAVELERLAVMATDPRMSVMCSLYRSNRLTALVRTVPAVVSELGGRLSEAVTDFWRVTPRTDMQFLSEAQDFCRYVRARFPNDAALVAATDTAEAELRSWFAAAPQEA